MVYEGRETPPDSMGCCSASVHSCFESGSVYLADQRVPVEVLRVRDQQRQVEVPLATYQQLQTPRALDDGLFRRALLLVGQS